MIVAINDKGREIASRLALQLGDEICQLSDIESRWNTEAHIIFIGAMGICVRSIAPFIKDKHTDPAVVCVDSLGKNVISVLSGHVGGANELTSRIAEILKANPVITTQSDLEGLWALDTIADRFGWVLPQENINKEIACFVAKQPTALYMEIKDEGTEYLLSSLPKHVTVVEKVSEITSDRFKLAIIVSPQEEILDDDILCVQYVPRCVHVGLGLAHQAEPVEQVVSEVFTAIGMAGIYAESIVDFNTIDLKSDEPVVKFLQEEGYKFNFYTSDQLAEVDVPNPSAMVSKHVGTPSVCEASVLIGGGKILLPKQKGLNWTVAASVRALAASSLRGKSDVDNIGVCVRAGGEASPHIEIVGAGPGDPELISVRGKRFLENADLILYAGSLVPKELTYYAKAGATVRSSADMDLEEQFELMKEFYDKGKQIVRLHTGDPCIYGAIQEQMAFFDKYGMDYHITPGISSFLAAAAELRSQFTIPERCQTIILTRGEGRTPMPDKEKLHMLASHQSTMCIFLSASLAEQVQAELLEGGYKPETPVACCYKLTWKDQRIYRGQLKDLAMIMKENHLSLTTMIVVGDAIDNREGLSKLYDGKFTHLFRPTPSPLP